MFPLNVKLLLYVFSTSATVIAIVKTSSGLNKLLFFWISISLVISSTAHVTTYFPYVNICIFVFFILPRRNAAETTHVFAYQNHFPNTWLAVSLYHKCHWICFPRLCFWKASCKHARQIMCLQSQSAVRGRQSCLQWNCWQHHALLKCTVWFRCISLHNLLEFQRHVYREGMCDVTWLQIWLPRM